MSNIKAIILDVDGVIIGTKRGFNFPKVHPKIINRLKQLKNSGITISLCTGRHHHSVIPIIEDAGLNNLHITDNGSILINGIAGKVESQKVINKQIALKILRQFEKKIHTEIYTVENWYTKQNTGIKFINLRTDILHRKPLLTNSLFAEAKKLPEINKIIFITKNQAETKKYSEELKTFASEVEIDWSSNPKLAPKQICMITSPGVSKRSAIMEVAESIDIPLKNFLGIGDNMIDWEFIELCGYGATLDNATNELKQLVLSKGKEHAHIGKHVDEHGILDILDYFLKKST